MASGVAGRVVPWPLPALLVWTACWLGFEALRTVGVPASLAGPGLAVLGGIAGLAAATPWRRTFVAVGFPLSFAASGLAGDGPAWAWLLPLAVLALVYPLRAWRDAPLFPTPKGALAGLGTRVPLAPMPCILDAGCGLGDALLELRREYPTAALTGIEWSWPLRLACAWRCRHAQVRRGDLWAADWAAFDLVYLFQRPESMARVVAKASAEMPAGRWLASLEFEAKAWRPQQVLTCADGRPLWLYRAPFVAATGPGS